MPKLTIEPISGARTADYLEGYEPLYLDLIYEIQELVRRADAAEQIESKSNRQVA